MFVLRHMLVAFLSCLGHLAIGGLYSGSLVWGQPAPSNPPPLLVYQGRTIAQTMHFTGADWLVRESRQREEDCETMLKELQLRAGMTVCDLGCGNGFYTRKLAELVGPQGVVYAVDIQPEMLHLLQLENIDAGQTQVRPILGTLTAPGLPPASCDRILCVDVYHEFSHPLHMLAAIRAALKPDGLLILVEFREEDPEVPIKPLHKMSKSQVLRELGPNGFNLAREFDGLPWQHMMCFGTGLNRSPSAPARESPLPRPADPSP